MNTEIRKKNFEEKSEKLFSFLVDDFSYQFFNKKVDEGEIQFHYKNEEADRYIIMRNTFEEDSPGFEIFFFRISDESLELEDGLCEIYEVFEAQDDDQSFLEEKANELEYNFAELLKGEVWIGEEEKPSLDEQLAKARTDLDKAFPPSFKKKQLIGYTIRTLISAVLFITFWEYEWVQWALIIYIPINLTGLYVIFNKKKILEKKLDKAEKGLNKKKEGYDFDTDIDFDDDE